MRGRFTRHPLSFYELQPEKPRTETVDTQSLTLFLPPSETTAAKPPSTTTSATTQPIGPTASAATEATFARATWAAPLSLAEAVESVFPLRARLLFFVGP